MRRERQLRLDGWMRLELWQVAFASLQDQLLCSWVLRRWQRCWRKGRQVERIEPWIEGYRWAGAAGGIHCFRCFFQVERGVINALFVCLESW